MYFSNSDNLPYAFCEQIGNEIRDISDEIPFEIPESWEWCRLSDITIKEIKRGKSPVYADSGSVLVFAQKCNVKTGGINISFAKYLADSAISKYPQEEYMQDGDIIVNSTGTGTLGRIGMYSNEDNHDNMTLVPDSHVTIVRVCSDISQYIYYILKWYQPYLEESGEGSTKQKELKADRIKELFIPIPPLSEQHRIVSKIEELLPYIERYGKAEEQLIALNTTFPEALKKSILQEAVQGKLVPQNPDDELASVLLERIRAEKQELIKAGKIKKDKHESVIVTRDKIPYEIIDGKERCIADEVPFEIPDNWCWCRLNQLGVFSSGKTPSMLEPAFWNGDIPWVSSKDMKKSIISDSEMHITELAAESMQIYPAGTLLLVARSGILRRMLPLCVLGIDSTINQDIKAFSLYDLSLSTWLYYTIKAFEPYILKELVKSITTVESLKFDEFSSMLIPIPPLVEQSRIISSIKASVKLLSPLVKDSMFML